MNYVSTKQFDSKACPGVRFVIRRMNERRRQALEETEAATAAREKLRPLFEEWNPLNRDYLEAYRVARAVGAKERQEYVASAPVATPGIYERLEAEALERWPIGKLAFSDEQWRRWLELKHQIQEISRRELGPAYLRGVVARIENLEIDGQAAGVEELLADGPDELREEVLAEVKRELGLLPAEAENLSSPSTSAAAVDGGKSTGSAVPAGMSETITAAAAGSSTGPANASVPVTA